MKNKKANIAIIGVIALVLVTIGLTYAYWLITRTQTKTNVIGAGCLDISLTDEQNDISLQNQFPLSDEEGMKLTPYTFTVTNNCNTSVDYQLNLELLGDSTSSISSTSIKVGLNDSSFILGNKETRETTESNAYTSYQLMYGRLEAKGTEGSSDTHNLRLWLDKDAPIEEMNKTLESKIVLRAGQGIKNPYTEGTLGFNIVGNAGGAGYVAELSTDLKEIELDAEEETWIPMPEILYWSNDYELDTTNGYTLSGDIIEATVQECREGTKECGEYTLLKYSASEKANTLYKVTSFTSDRGDWYIIAKRRILENEFNYVTTADYAKLHQTEDDLGISYYYRGAPTNNYVKFGSYQENSTEIRGYYDETSSSYVNYTTLDECNAASSYKYNCTEVKKEEAGKDMYWRIVRINGDGTIRMIYDGIEAVANGVSHKATVGNKSYNPYIVDQKYVGYTYEGEDGTQTDSTIKSYIDTWYNTNLKTNYGTYISDSIFCNDRTSRVDDVYSQIYYGAYDRLRTNKIPKLICSQKEDRYTMNTEYGNGYLTNPVGLITADEVAMAGGHYNKSNDTYYLGNVDVEYYWTMTPGYFNNQNATGWNVYNNGSMDIYYVQNCQGGARPVINLKADVAFTGEGTIDSPYEIGTN